jgi:hypothetical protein
VYDIESNLEIKDIKYVYDIESNLEIKDIKYVYDIESGNKGHKICV